MVSTSIPSTVVHNDTKSDRQHHHYATVEDSASTMKSDDSVGAESSSSISSSKHGDKHGRGVGGTLPPKKRTKMIDETLLSSDEAEKLLAKRAYNRECANRARLRGKNMVTELRNKVEELEDDKKALRRSLKTLEKQLIALENQNKELLLRQNRVATTSMTSASVATSPSMRSMPLASKAAASGTRLPMNMSSLTPGLSSSLLLGRYHQLQRGFDGGATNAYQYPNTATAGIEVSPSSLEYYHLLQRQLYER